MSQKPNRLIRRRCSDCGEELVISPRSQEYYQENGLALPKRCKKCRSARKEVCETRTCVDCGAEFTINMNQKKFYSERGLDTPKRCPECISKKHERYAKKTEQK